MHRQDSSTRRSLLAGTSAGLATLGLLLLSWLFFVYDAALLPHAVATVMLVGILTYRFALWCHRPPTAALYRRGLAAMRSPRRWLRLAPRLGAYFIANRFVWRRAAGRWLAHWPIMAGCVLAAAVVVPLIFGWVHFQTPGQDFGSYQLIVFGLPGIVFATDSLLALLLFHGLVWASLLVLVGTGTALLRRLRHRGDRAVQTFGNDFLPLLLLMLVSITGLALFVSYGFFGGVGHRLCVWIHAIAVIATMIWLPFGKLLHVPQRNIRLAQAFAAAADDDDRQHCARCRQPYASQAQIAELQAVEAALGYDYRIPDSPVDSPVAAHYQEVCPRCRRHLLVGAQGRRWQTCHAPMRSPALQEAS